MHAYFHLQRSAVSSVGKGPGFRSRCRSFESHKGCGVVSLSETLHLNCILLVQRMKTSRRERKYIDWDVNPQPKQTKGFINSFKSAECHTYVRLHLSNIRFIQKIIFAYVA